MKKQAVLFISLLGLILLTILLATGQIKVIRTPGSQVVITQSQTSSTPEESDVIKAVRNSIPSVVTVGINTTINSLPSFQFGPFSLPQALPQQQQLNQNIGSGFIVSPDGLIITNKHVVSDISATYKVITNDNKKYDVEKIYRDPLNDLAIIRINSGNLKPLSMGDSNNLQLGQTAIAIGTPLGEFQNTVTVGVISGLNRGITAGSQFQGSVERLNNVIQTDAPISPGNSGGPLLDSSGNAIGINTAVSQSGSNIGFAIPINAVKDLINAFNNTGGNFQQPFIGIRYTMIDQNQANAASVVPGALAVEVISGSPADKAGIKQGDVITGLGGDKIDPGNQDLAAAILKHKVGETIPVVIWRNGQNQTVQVTLQAAP